MFKISNLTVSIDDKEILKNFGIEVGPGEVHAIMGPNGSGKSTLAHVCAGKEEYTVLSGNVVLNDEELLEMEPEERSTRGLFLAFQYPIEIPGVTTMTFLKSSLEAHYKANGREPLTTPEFMKYVKSKATELNIDDSMIKRPLNVGFSGGEKKRNEILQMALLDPKICILDETDSGLDIDALRLVAEGVNKLRNDNRSFIVITHYQRLLDYIKPDFVHIMHDGKIIQTGDSSLALDLEKSGYANYIK
ncbi:MAG: Fe-S cluster assembly ATPase SufC [Alphaproteobacteria bacterium]|uniref:Fe-S cluster assembly ATPase SufC n=1 Tax=PS1 clade bacterium TaxID=2175152 RepID=A0A368DPC8_9PROT|nr:Fe-S cluster assembly ATPase SufC [Rhodobiaceae bacterium]OUT73764.1 MAG: Fe-S cluster assembly ATPase SufC [Rhizobiales bacterium TMED25]RCL73698.1 MAG: Fe-S cluster assembly ATPase SufC [PS1 clade bacterium]|tara:strand:+ start:1320 stop:2060 length:741 start_codon:yes stop_codon:yes gene_type:complete